MAKRKYNLSPKALAARKTAALWHSRYAELRRRFKEQKEIGNIKADYLQIPTKKLQHLYKTYYEFSQNKKNVMTRFFNVELTKVNKELHYTEKTHQLRLGTDLDRYYKWIHNNEAWVHTRFNVVNEDSTLLFTPTNTVGGGTVELIKIFLDASSKEVFLSGLDSKTIVSLNYLFIEGYTY